MKLHARHISLKVLALEGIFYRLHNLVLGAVVFYIFFQDATIAFSGSLAINILHTAFYYHFHFWWSRYVMIGERKHDNKR